MYKKWLKDYNEWLTTFDIEDWFHILHKYPDNILDKWGEYEVRIHKGMDKIFQLLKFPYS